MATFCDLMFSPLLRLLKGRTVLLVCPNGNVGDQLVQKATMQLFRRHGIAFQVANFASFEQHTAGYDVMAYGGGGNVSGRYDTEKHVRAMAAQAKRLGVPLVCLPQSIEAWKPHLLLFDQLFIREEVSLQLAAFAGCSPVLCPDMALAYQPEAPLAEPLHDEALFLRSSSEGLHRGMAEDAVTGVRTPQEYVEKASAYRRITTDRLHFAIAGLIAGREVTLVANNYHKNKSMWQTWLQFAGCRFKDRHVVSPS